MYGHVSSIDTSVSEPAVMYRLNANKDKQQTDIIMNSHTSRIRNTQSKALQIIAETVCGSFYANF